MATQPQLPNDHGVVLTCGIQVATDRTAIVLPLVNDGTGLEPSIICADAITSFETSILPLLVECISSLAFVSFLAAEGMVDGKVPHRNVYDPTEFPGTGPTSPCSTQVAGLIVFYEDPADVVPGHKMRVAKQFIPAIPSGNVAGNFIDSGLSAALDALGVQLQTGFDSFGEPTTKWWRQLATPKPRTAGTMVKRTINTQVRGEVYTQKRRLVPRY